MDWEETRSVKKTDPQKHFIYLKFSSFFFSLLFLSILSTPHTMRLDTTFRRSCVCTGQGGSWSWRSASTKAGTRLWEQNKNGNWRMWVWRFVFPSLWSHFDSHFFFKRIATRILCFLQNQLFYFPGRNMCLTARQDHPSLARCNPSDRYQQWSFIWVCETYTPHCMHEHTGTHVFNNAGFVFFYF